jgi:hypothetical protein
MQVCNTQACANSIARYLLHTCVACTTHTQSHSQHTLHTINRVLITTIACLFVFDSALFLRPGYLGHDLLLIDRSIPWWFMFASWLWAIAVGCCAVAFERCIVAKRENFWFEQQRTGIMVASGNQRQNRPVTRTVRATGNNGGLSLSPPAPNQYTLV